MPAKLTTRQSTKLEAKTSPIAAPTFTALMSNAKPAAAARLGVTQTAVSIIANTHSVVRNPLAVSMAIEVGTDR